MSDTKATGPGRRAVLGGMAATAGLAAGASFVPTRFAIGQQAKVKLGLMLPYTGTYAQLGQAITEGLKLALAEHGAAPGSRPSRLRHRRVSLSFV